MTLNSGREIAVVFITAPDRRTARALATSALRHRLAACVNLLPGVESHYWWQGKLETGSEVLMLLKTTRPNLSALQKLILSNHPYETAEFVVLPVAGGARRYLAWWSKETTPR
jgi:periplasmic divalent cation tolerance protein